MDVIDIKYIEPFCGNGKYLEEILNKKIKILNEKHKDLFSDRFSKGKTEYIRDFILAVGNIKGFDINPENVQESRDRLLKIIKNNTEKYVLFSDSNVFHYILTKNIRVGYYDNNSDLLYSSFHYNDGYLIEDLHDAYPITDGVKKVRTANIDTKRGFTIGDVLTVEKYIK